MNRMRIGFVAWFSETLALMALFASAGFAERLPIRTYTSADGLPSVKVDCIVHDSRQFLWLCTPDGLVRFDGYTFTTYSVDRGLPNRRVTAFLETRRGAIWVGTFNGLARFEPDSMRTRRALFVHYAMPGPESSQQITALAEGEDESIWCGTRNGVYRLTPTGLLEPVHLGLADPHLTNRMVRTMVVDREGGLWTGTSGQGLFRRSRDGSVDHFAGDSLVYSLRMDHNGRIWAAAGGALHVFEPPIGSGKATLLKTFRMNDGLPHVRIRSVAETPDGKIWVGTEGGLAVLAPGAGTFHSYDSGNGLSDIQIRELGTDPDGNLWIGAESSLMRLERSGLATYDSADGLSGNWVVSVLEGGRDGQVYFVSGIRKVAIHRFDGTRFSAVRPLLRHSGKPLTYMGWGTGQTVFQDADGDWWIPTGEGLCRFTGNRRFEDLERAPPEKVYTERDGLPGNDIFRLFEDRQRDLWISTVDKPGLARWERRTGQIHRAGEAEGFATPNPPSAFAEDRQGDLWVGMYWSGLGRRRNGRWQMFTAADGVPDGIVGGLLIDRRGSLWVGTTNGLARVDDPTAERPRFERISTDRGLASDVVTSLTQDRRGVIYIASPRGLDAFNPETGRVSHFNSLDGLVAGDISTSFCDSRGTLWFGAMTGLSRLIPGPDPASVPPPIRISGIRVAGVDRPVSAFGELTISGLTLEPFQNHLDLDLASQGFRPGARIGYQYRLKGSGAWTPPSDIHTITLAALGPGAYELEARAVRDGIPSARPAAVSFRVLPPAWRRWWAISIAAVLVMLLLYSAHRYRLAHVIRMERVRTRIAMDLHDDLGSTLSNISILSELARRQMGSADGLKSLTRLAELARELVASMGDIVWSVNPQRDRGADLIQRMRRFGQDLLNGQEISFHCAASDSVLDAGIPPDVRRDVYLIFKESINNIARHARCGHATAELTTLSGELRLEVRDDGVGFRLSGNGSGPGHGLTSMRKRAEQMGGRLQIESADQGGTKVVLSVPLRHHLLRHHLFRW